jgi:hypothetical protein
MLSSCFHLAPGQGVSAVRIILLRSLAFLLVTSLLSACNSTFVAVSNNGAFFLAVSSNSLLLPQGGLPTPLSVTVNGAPSASFLVVTGMPMGVTAHITQPNSSGSSIISFQAASSASVGSYPIQILCTSGSASTSKSVTLVVVVSTTISAFAVTPVGFDAQFDTLRQLFPFSSVASPTVLGTTVSDPALQVFATRYSDGSYVIMLRDSGSASEPHTVIVDVSALGDYSSVSQLTLQSDTDFTNGPQPTTLSPAPKLSVTLKGYGTAFLHLIP